MTFRACSHSDTSILLSVALNSFHVSSQHFCPSAVRNSSTDKSINKGKSFNCLHSSMLILLLCSLMKMVNSITGHLLLRNSSLRTTTATSACRQTSFMRWANGSPLGKQSGLSSKKGWYALRSRAFRRGRVNAFWAPLWLKNMLCFCCAYLHRHRSPNSSTLFDFNKAQIAAQGPILWQPYRSQTPKWPFYHTRCIHTPISFIEWNVCVHESSQSSFLLVQRYWSLCRLLDCGMTSCAASWLKHDIRLPRPLLETVLYINHPQMSTLTQSKGMPWWYQSI